MITACSTYSFEIKKQILGILINKGANIHDRDRWDNTTLMCASSIKYNQETVQLLLDKGARIDDDDEYGRNALHCAIAAGALTEGMTENVKVLVEYAANFF